MKHQEDVARLQDELKRAKCAGGESATIRELELQEERLKLMVRPLVVYLKLVAYGVYIDNPALFDL